MKSGFSGSADESVVVQSSPLADSESSAAGLRRAGGQARGGAAGRCHVAPTPSIDLPLGPPLVHRACGVEGRPAVLWASAGESDSDAESAPAGGPGPAARR